MENGRDGQSGRSRQPTVSRSPALDLKSKAIAGITDTSFSTAPAMNSFEEAILDAAQASTEHGTEPEKAAAKAAAQEAILAITRDLKGLERTRALAALLDSYSEDEEL